MLDQERELNMWLGWGQDVVNSRFCWEFTLENDNLVEEEGMAREYYTAP
jgi:hypothetical protein